MSSCNPGQSRLLAQSPKLAINPNNVALDKILASSLCNCRRIADAGVPPARRNNGHEDRKAVAKRQARSRSLDRCR